MKVFYDTEFVERGPQLPLIPVSIGLVAEDGREFYGINEECLTNVTRHPWLSVNVKPQLPIRDEQHTSGGFITMWDPDHVEYEHVYALEHLATLVRDFLTFTPDLQLWADYGAYDHVVLCQLFGDMNGLPPGIPMFTRDIQQLLDFYQTAKLPPTPEIPHHALWDARWTRDAYTAIVTSDLEFRM